MAEDLILSHWHQSIEGLGIVPSEFYAAVETAITTHKVPDVALTRVKQAEGGAFSAQREYLRVRRGEYHFDICGAPFANGSFVSWWLVQEAGCARGCLSVIPVLGWMLLAFLYRETYYKIDTRLMFQGAIHSAVLEVVDALTKAKGLRALEGEERKPTIRKLLG